MGIKKSNNFSSNLFFSVNTRNDDIGTCIYILGISLLTQFSMIATNEVT